MAGIGTDQLFLTLYRELYFRHVYAKLEPNVDDRFQSYENICELFNLLLSKSLVASSCNVSC